MSKKKRIVELRDEEGLIYPLTHLRAVYNSDGVPLDELLSNIEAGEANLSDIRAAIRELQEQVFPLSASLTAKDAPYEYTGVEKASEFAYDVYFRGNSVLSTEVKEIELTASGGISYGEPTTSQKGVAFVISKPDNFDGVRDYSATIKFILNNGRETEKTCNFSQISPSWVGWYNGEYSEYADGSWINPQTLNNSSISGMNMKKVVSKNISGTYKWDSIPIGSCFWIIVPASRLISGYSNVMGNSMPSLISEQGRIIINGVEYKCLRNTSGPIQVANKSWTMILSN